MNQQNHGQQQPHVSFFMRSMEGLANVIAFGLTFFVAPPLFNVTLPAAQAFTRWQWGFGFEGLTSLFWAVFCAALVFYGSRATVGAALMSAAIGFALRALMAV